MTVKADLNIYLKGELTGEAGYFSDPILEISDFLFPDILFEGLILIIDFDFDIYHFEICKVKLCTDIRGSLRYIDVDCEFQENINGVLLEEYLKENMSNGTYQFHLDDFRVHLDDIREQIEKGPRTIKC